MQNLQRTCIAWIKQHKTVRIIHLFRQYSALSVVISSTVLVTGSNITSRYEENSILSGYFHRESSSSSQGYKNLSVVPIALASSTVDTEANIEDDTSTEDEDTIIASANTAPLIQEDPEEEESVTLYTIEDGDTLSGIAEKHKITVNTILWANDIENLDEIRPGDQIFILPVAGLKYVVQDGDTIEDIAKKYHGNMDRIIAFNDLPANGRLEVGNEIIIPDGYKEVPKPKEDTSLLDRRQYATEEGGATTDISGWRTPDGKAGAGHKFPYGYCTWYVAQNRYVPWGGNAGTWLYNAKALGYKTGKTPRVGSIVVTTDNRYYGHVALVEKVSNGEITVSEMNYVRWGKTNKRTISTSSRSIKGYIY